ncbi:MAG: class I SAM-dependent methyltransferase [Myxococcota bacterium]
MDQPDGFVDRFGPRATAYARYRPSYPAALFEMIADLAPTRDRCWDCATGNGQAATSLAQHFVQVVATDRSEAQLANAVSGHGVTYRREAAEATSLPDASVDAITVASALHWLDRSSFYAEVSRVAVPGAVIAVWTYSTRVDVSPEVDALLRRVAVEILGPYWSESWHDVETGYRDVPFPFAPLDAPKFDLRMTWTLDDLLGFVNTWSAAIRFHQERGSFATEPLEGELRGAWGPAEARQAIIPLHLRMGRVARPAG